MKMHLGRHALLTKQLFLVGKTVLYWVTDTLVLHKFSLKSFSYGKETYPAAMYLLRKNAQKIFICQPVAKQMLCFDFASQTNYGLLSVKVIPLTTLQSMMNAKLNKQRFWHCYENGLIKTIQTIPHNLYVSVKLSLSQVWWSWSGRSYQFISISDWCHLEGFSRYRPGPFRDW